MRLWRAREWSGVVAVDNLGVRSTSKQNVVLSSLGRFPGLGCARSFLAGKIGLGEALLACLGLPVVVSNSSAINNDSASELAEHGPGGNNCDLPGTVRKREDLLLNKVVLLGLAGNDLVKRSVLIEQEVGVSITQNPGAFGSKHEKLVTSVGN
jgi:hypothetical protein